MCVLMQRLLKQQSDLHVEHEVDVSWVAESMLWAVTKGVEVLCAASLRRGAG